MSVVLTSGRVPATVEVAGPEKVSTPGKLAAPRAAATFAIISILLQAARGGYVLSGGSARIATFLPDDAFYYFGLARNYAETGRWTFDGVAPATGFHLLWAYLWAAAFAIVPQMGLDTIFTVAFIAGLTCYVVAAWALWALVTECYGPSATLSVSAIFLASTVFLLPALGMESGPTLLFASLACLLVFGGDRHRRPWKRLAALYLVGALGMLSRSDFGVLSACLLAIRLFENARQRPLELRRLGLAATLFAGSLTGLALIILHSITVSGELVQSSVRMKRYWSGLAGDSIRAPVHLLTGMFTYKLPLGAVLGYAVLLGLCGAIAAGAVYARRSRLSLAPLGGGVLAIALYIALYSDDSRALQPWYAASFAAPLVLALAPAFAAAARRHRRSAIAIVAFAAAAFYLQSVRPFWRHQFAMKDAGEILATHPGLRPVAAWNAGLISFFAARPVTNLDGLVNDEIFPYARSGTLARYIADRRIAYIIDYSAMFTPALARRGGYANGRLVACLRPEREIDANDPASRWQGSTLTLYKVDSSCLESKPSRPGAIIRAQR